MLPWEGGGSRWGTKVSQAEEHLGATWRGGRKVENRRRRERRGGEGGGGGGGIGGAVANDGLCRGA